MRWAGGFLLGDLNPPVSDRRTRPSGHGHFDMEAYEQDFAGDLVDYDYPEEKVLKALAKLPPID